MPGGSFGTHRITESIAHSDDAFGNRVVQNTINNADIAGHYPYSPERWRVDVNGERQLIQYGSVAEYEDAVDVHRLQPQTSGDVVTMRTPELYRYVVGFVLEWSGAFQTNQPLGDGDVVVFGYGDPDLENATSDEPGPGADGWFFYWNSSHGEGEVTVAQYRDGVEQDAKTVQAEKPLSTFARYEGRTNWYAVGRTKFVQTWTNNGTQLNGLGEDRRDTGPEDAGVSTSKDNGRSALVGNHAMTASVKAGSGAGSLVLELGSVGLKTLGDVSPIVRQKTHTWSGAPSATGAWTPVHAFRIDPGRELVNTQLTNTDIVAYEGSGDVLASIHSFDPSLVLDSNGDPLTDANYSTPESHNATNSVLEVTSDVAQVPDVNGTPQTSMANPGGYQIGYASWYASGSGSKTAVSSGSATRKRALPPGDVGVVLVNADESAEVVGESISEQDW